MNKWQDNIQEHGVLCKDTEGNFHKVISKSKEGVRTSKRKVFNPDNLTPLTPEEWWQLAPWNYDIDSAPKEDSKALLLKDIYGHIHKMWWDKNGKWSSGWTYINNPIAWLPLPEKK